MISKLLDVSVRHKIPVTVWTKNQTVKFETAFTSFMPNLKRLSLLLPETVDEKQFQEAAKAQGNEILGSFQIDTVNFFFKTTFMQKVDKNQLLIQIPKEIFKLQRRANLRIPFPRKMAPKLTVFNPAKEFDVTQAIDPKDILPYRVIDVSAGGVAIAVRIEDKALFPRDKMIYDLRFKLRGMEIVCNGIIRHTAEILNEAGKPILKVGIQYHGLKMVFEKHIVQFVLDESRKLFSLLH